MWDTVRDLGDVCALADGRASATEAAGRLHPDVVDALVGAGLFRLLVPADYGGPAEPLGRVLDTIEAVSRADGAAGWCVMIANTTALTAHHLRPDWADKIYGDRASCTGGFGMPAGTATVVDGGLRVSGHWSWGSGTDHCTWIGGGVRVVDDHGRPAVTSDGARTPFVFFDPVDVALLDTWHVAGLKGTASTDYTVTDAFVPEGRWAQLAGARPRLDGPAARFSFFGALAAGVASVTIGLARRAVDELVALADKQPAGSSRSLGERAAIQADLALATADVGQAHAYLHAVVDRAWRRASAGAVVDDDTRVELRLAATAAARRAAEAVDRCYHAAGGTAVYETSPLQRVFRDVHVATQHGMIAARTLEPIGRRAFGLPTSLDQL